MKDKASEAARHKAWLAANLEKRRAYEKAYRQAHRDRIRAYLSDYGKANRERLTAYGKAYRQAHPAVELVGTVVRIHTLPPDLQRVALLIRDTRRELKGRNKA